MTDQHSLTDRIYLNLEPVTVDYQTLYSILARKVSIASVHLEAYDSASDALAELREALKLVEHVEKMQTQVQITVPAKENN